MSSDEETFEVTFEARTEQVAQHLAELSAKLDALTALTAQKQSAGMKGARPMLIQVDEASQFPEHEHVWTVVEIDNNPVGVTCKICDSVFEVGPGVRRAKRPLLDLSIGAVHRVEVGYGHADATVRTVAQHSERQGGQSITVELDIQPPF